MQLTVYLIQVQLALMSFMVGLPVSSETQSPHNYGSHNDRLQGKFTGTYTYSYQGTITLIYSSREQTVVKYRIEYVYK